MESRGKSYTFCVRSVLLYGSENWVPTVAVLQRLQHNVRSMICWICDDKPKDRSPSSVFLTKLKIPDLETLLQSRRLRWYDHVKRSSMCIKDVLEFPLPRGRSKPFWAYQASCYYLNPTFALERSTPRYTLHVQITSFCLFEELPEHLECQVLKELSESKRYHLF